MSYFWGCRDLCLIPVENCHPLDPDPNSVSLLLVYSSKECCFPIFLNYVFMLRVGQKLFNVFTISG